MIGRTDFNEKPGVEIGHRVDSPPAQRRNKGPYDMGIISATLITEFGTRDM